MKFGQWTPSGNLHLPAHPYAALRSFCKSAPSLLYPQATTDLHSATSGFAFFRPSHKCLASLTNIMHIRITHVFAFSWQESIPFYCCAVSHGADVQQPTSIHQLLDIWVASSFRVIPNNVAVNIHVHIIVWAYVFISLSQTPRSGTADSYDVYV